MTIKAKENTFGAWAFLIGIIMALLIGISTSRFMPVGTLNKYSSAIYGVLILIGLIVGFTNVASKDNQTFLISGTVLVIVSGFGMESVSGSLIGFPIANLVKTVFSALLTMFVPATIVVALKTMFGIANL